MMLLFLPYLFSADLSCSGNMHVPQHASAYDTNEKCRCKAKNRHHSFILHIVCHPHSPPQSSTARWGDSSRQGKHANSARYQQGV